MSKYIDDILIHLPIMEAHLYHLRQVFDKLKEAGLTLPECKCKIGSPQVYYLTKSGMTPDHNKIEAVKNWPRIGSAPVSRISILLQTLH